MKKVMTYLDYHYLKPSESSQPSLTYSALKNFRQRVLPIVDDFLQNIILDEIKKDRNGENTDKEILRKVLTHFNELSLGKNALIKR